MIINPIIPLWLMIIISVALLVVVITNKKRIIIRVLMIILLFLTNLRFMLPNGKIEKITNNLNVLFVIDNSISMTAEDYGGRTRLSALQEDCKYIISSLSGSSYALITFSNSSNIVMPFINDGDMIRNAIESIKTKNSLYAKGSSLFVPVEDMEFILDDNVDTNKDTQTIVFYISDGEVTSDDFKSGKFQGLKKYIDNGAVLGYGTTSGGKMKADKYYSYKDSAGYMLDNTATGYPKPLAISKIDEGNLKNIANELGVDYIHMTNKNQIDNKLSTIVSKAVKAEPIEEETYKDIYYIFTSILLVLLFFEFIYIRRRLI